MLGYEVVWSHIFSLALGHEMPGVLAVLMAFFLGIALGAWSLDSVVSRSLFPGRWYGGLELSAGIWAVLTAWLIPLGNQVSFRVLGPSPSPFLYWLAGFSLAFLTLLPSTAALGGALAAMERWLSPHSREERCVGMLYAVNSAGSVAGILLVLVLLPHWGWRDTLLLLGTANAACGLLALNFFSVRRQRLVPPAPSAPWAAAKHLHGILFFTGLLGIGYQVLGVRVLAQVLEDTVYTFSLVVAVYLLGLAAGAAAYQRLGRRRALQPTLSRLLSSLMLAGLLGFTAMTWAEPAYRWIRGGLGEGPVGGLAAEALLAALIFLVPTSCMGAVLSHLVQGARTSQGGVGRAAAVNTVGSALAPLLFGVILLPLLGIKGAAGVLLSGYALLSVSRSQRFWKIATPALLLWWFLPPVLPRLYLEAGTELEKYIDGVLGSVLVVRSADGHRSLRVDRHFVMGGTATAGAAYRQAHIPLLLHPEPRRALFLGVGTGMTLGAATVHPRLRADGVELVPELLQILPLFAPENLSPQSHPAVRLYAADARRFVQASRETYDVIVGELYHPARNGAGGLYTLEHFQAVRQRLAPGGLFCQWLSLFQLDEPVLKVIVRTFLEVFPHATAYLLRPSIDAPVLGLVGTLEPISYPAGWMKHRVQDPGLARHLDRAALSVDVHLFGSLLADSTSLRDFSRGADLNTDVHPLVTFEAPRFVYSLGTDSAGRLLALLDRSSSFPAGILEAETDPPAKELLRDLSRYVSARNLYLHGLVQEASGEMAKALRLYVESARLSPHFPAAYARCLLLAWGWFRQDPDQARRLLEQLQAARPENPVARRLLHSWFAGAGPEDSGTRR